MEEVGLEDSYQQMMTNNDYYTAEEFDGAFNEFLTFLKDPNTAVDCFGSINDKGRKLASKRLYEMANKYRFLRFLIDKKTHFLHDSALICFWAAIETNTIVANWTGINLAGKIKLWLKAKIKAQQEKSASQGKRNVWAFLGRQGAEKQQKQES